MLMKGNEAEQKLAMRQLIVINSTGPGRHRKAPSEFSGAKTVKKKQLMSSISTTTLRGNANLQRALILPAAALTGAQGVSDGNTVPGLEQPLPKSYREEDSINATLAFESNQVGDPSIAAGQ